VNMGILLTYATMAIWLVVAVALAVGGLLLVRRKHSHEVMEQHHAVAGPFLSIIATLYAVVLGFIVIDALNTFQDARVTVEREANAFHDIWHLAQGLPAPASTTIRKLCYDYCDTMVNREWPDMEQGKPSDTGHDVFTRLWHEVCHFQPKNQAEDTFLDNLIGELKSAGDARHTRLLAAQPAYDPAIWLVLGTGSVVTIVFTYFFGVQNLRVQALMTALVTIVVVLNLVVVALFDSPFSGDVKVSPAAFQADLNYFNLEMSNK
jgi:hypothetical protein